MKVIPWVVVSLASSIVILAGAQKTPDPSNAVQKMQPIPPKTLPSPYQPPAPIPNFPSNRERPVAITADKRTVIGKSVQYRGHVLMTTDSVIVTADELNFDTSTQSAKATGNVEIQVRPPGPLVVPLGQ